jgi:hypothetical protein
MRNFEYLTKYLNLSELEKLIGIDPLIERSLIVIKRLNILRKQ